MEEIKNALYWTSQVFLILFSIIFTFAMLGNFIPELEMQDFYIRIVRDFLFPVLSIMYKLLIPAIIIILFKNYDNSGIPKEKSTDGLSTTTNIALGIIAFFVIFFIFMFSVMWMGGR